MTAGFSQALLLLLRPLFLITLLLKLVNPGNWSKFPSLQLTSGPIDKILAGPNFLKNSLILSKFHCPIMLCNSSVCFWMEKHRKTIRPDNMSGLLSPTFHPAELSLPAKRQGLAQGQGQPGNYKAERARKLLTYCGFQRFRPVSNWSLTRMERLCQLWAKNRNGKRTMKQKNVELENLGPKKWKRQSSHIFLTGRGPRREWASGHKPLRLLRHKLWHTANTWHIFRMISEEKHGISDIFSNACYLDIYSDVFLGLFSRINIYRQIDR